MILKSPILNDVDSNINIICYIIMNGVIFFTIYYLIGLLFNHYFEKIKWNDSFLNIRDKKLWKYTFIWIIFISLYKYFII